MGWDKNRPEEKRITPFKYTSDSDDIKKLTVDEIREMVKWQ